MESRSDVLSRNSVLTNSDSSANQDLAVDGLTLSPSGQNVDARARLAAATERARNGYVALIAGEQSSPWWDAVILTASSERQAERYREEIRRRKARGTIPPQALYLVAPDEGDRRLGSGGATIHALRLFAEQTLAAEGAASLSEWWSGQRVLMIHSGGDSRRLPQYSLSGKLFSALPVETAWGERSTVFDETLMLSTLWAERMPCGLLVGSGDVILTFEPEGLDRPGVTGVAIRQSVETGAQHGVYVTDEHGRVYSFLQKPSRAEVIAAGGLLDDDKVAVDTGLLRFDAETAGRLTELAGARLDRGRLEWDAGIIGGNSEDLPPLDLYLHFTCALTGQWRPSPKADLRWRRLAGALEGTPFWCTLVPGEFTHVGTTRHFRRLFTEDNQLEKLRESQERTGLVAPSGVRSAGVVTDSVLTGGGDLSPGSIVIECHLDVPVRAGRGAILHGLEGLPGPVEVPEDVVVHQVPVLTAEGRRGTVMRVYHVEDDSKATLESGKATWFKSPFLQTLAALGIDSELVWPEIPESERSLWNAALFPVASTEEAWECARWLMGFPADYTPEKWRHACRLSLAESAARADSQTLAEAQTRRLHANWQSTAVTLALKGADIRPILANSPGIAPLAATGRSLRKEAGALVERTPTQAASLLFQSNLFFAQAGLTGEAAKARQEAFELVRRAVDLGSETGETEGGARQWRYHEVEVSAPSRIDLGGGWSDTPPFCLDWGGTVLNVALSINSEFPIGTRIRRLEQSMVRCLSDETGEIAEFTRMEELLSPAEAGSVFSIPRIALQMSGLLNERQGLPQVLECLGGGIEIRVGANLPLGSGLGTSSILAATVLRALAEMLGADLTPAELTARVMRLEQLMTTGGGWQDQAGAVFPGAKLLTSAPGLRQHLRVQPLAWSEERKREFSDRLVLYYTGIRRIAKKLLAQVVGSYLARETATVQVLHSIKTLATEMAHAMCEGDWPCLGSLMNRHWELNQVLDPATTNAPISAMLEDARPFLHGAKLAGAGGGGFALLLAKDPEAAAALKTRLAKRGEGSIHDFAIAETGWKIDRR